MSDLAKALARIEQLEKSLSRERRIRDQTEATLRRRGGDAAMAEAEAAYLRSQLVHGHQIEQSRLQAKCEAQRKDIVRLQRKLAELGGAT